MGEVITKFTSDDREVQRAYDNLYKKHLALEQRMQQTAAAAKQAHDQEKSGIEGVVGSLTGLVGSYVSAQAMLSLYNRELQRKLELERKSLETNVSLADAQAKMNRMMVGTSQKERDTVRSEAARIVAESGVPEREVAAGMADALAARGNLSFKAVTDAVRAAAKSAPESNAGDTRTVTSGALLDLAKISGTTDAEKNLGSLLSMTTASRVRDQGLVARNLVPGLRGIMARGDTLKEAMGLESGLSHAIGDTEGAVTSTAALQLAEQLAKAMPDEKSTAARIAALQKNAAERERFLKGASFEVKARPAIESLLRGQDAAQMVRDATGQIATGAEAAGVAKGLFTMHEETAAGKLAASQRQIEAGAAAMSAADVAGARSALARKFIEEGPEKHIHWFGRMMNEFDLQIGRNPLAVSEHALREAKMMLRGGRTVGTPGAEQQIAILDRMYEELKKQSAALDRMSRTGDRGQRGPAEVVPAKER